MPDSVGAISSDLRPLRVDQRLSPIGAAPSTAFEPTVRTSAYELLIEAYLMLALVKMFGVVSSSFFYRQTQLTMFIALVGLILVVTAPQEVSGRVRVNVFALLTMAWYALSGFWTPDGDAWQEFMFFLVAVPAVVMVLLGVIPFERVMVAIKRLTYIVIAWTFLVAAAMPSRTTVHESFGNEPVLPGWHGTFVHKNEMMTFFVVGLIAVLTFERDRRLRWGAVGLIMVLGVLGQSGTGLAVVVLTLLGHISVRRLQQQQGKTRELFLLAIIGAWTLLAATLLILGPTLVRLYGKDLTFTGRTRIWSAVLDAVAQHPWRGHGLGSVWVDFATQPTASMERSIGFRASHAHNGALELLLEVGVIGLLLWLGCFLAALKSCWNARHTVPEAARWGLLTLAATVQFSVSETPTFRGPWVLVVAMVPLMASAVHSRSQRQGESVLHAEWPERLSN